MLDARARRKPLVFSAVFFITLFSFDGVASESMNFTFHSFTLRNLTLLGDAYLRNGVVGLTRELGVPSASSGTVTYNRPIRFHDPESNTTASFSITFKFSIRNLNPTSYGDGLAFFLSPDNQTLGSPGGFLGLVNASQPSKNRFLAVEFDTRLDPEFDDPNDNHVGVDIDGLNSVKTADPILQGVDLKSGRSITAWIDYRNDLRVLDVFLSYSESFLKPERPLLSVDFDLSLYTREPVYVGFSGSTEGSTEVHLIEDWSFGTHGFIPLRPRSHPHNVSDNSVTMTPYIPAPSSADNRRSKLGMGLGIAGPVVFFIALSVFGYISAKKWKSLKAEKNQKADFAAGPREFTYKELYTATKGFHESRVIGGGAFGTVYKALFISSGTMAAVKRSKHTHEGKSEFLAELSIIACLRHKNLVQLQGWSAEKGELLLVYEFMPNGSLDKVLYQEPEIGILLNWSRRMNVAVGLASALTYLHQECEQQVIHRDIKTSNVMLDANFNARLGDFGLARLMEHDKSPVSTLTAGTMGYLAPEYLQYGIATEKTDVFSYGVVILEVACGRRPIERESESQRMVNLVDWVWRLHGEGRIVEAADRRLSGEFNVDEMKKLLLAGLSCAHPDCNKRPSMRRVLQMLSNEAEPLAVPRMKPTLSFTCGLSLSDIVSDSEDV